MHSTVGERYARAKADDAMLQARVHMLDELILEWITATVAQQLPQQRVKKRTY
jgi:hypothetical protein